MKKIIYKSFILMVAVFLSVLFIAPTMLYAATVDIAAIPGVTAPVTGATPVTVITPTAQYTGTVTWAPADDPFNAGTVYTATITLTAKAGYTLTGVGANFFTVAGATATNAAGSGVVTAVFPATAAATTSATTPNYVQQTVGAGTVTVDASSVAGAYAIVTGSGGQTVTIEEISSADASAGGFSIEGATTYVDLHLDSSEGIEQIQFTILGGAGIPRWWNGSTWIECSNYTIDAAGNVTTTITNSTTPSLSDLTGTVFAVVPGPVRTHEMTCWQIYVNEEGSFEFIFWWEYANNNWVSIYDSQENLVYREDFPKGEPIVEVDLPDGFYTVKTFHEEGNILQEFVIGK